MISKRLTFTPIYNIWLLLVCIVASTLVFAQAAPDYTQFIPKNWVLERSIPRDIDKNGTQDALLILLEAGPQEKDGTPNTRKRQLVVLMSDQSGKLTRTSVAKDLLICTTCAGMMSGMGIAEPYVEYEDDNLLYVNWLSGSRVSYETTLIFDYDNKLKSLVLIADEVERRDRAVGKSSFTRRDYQKGVKTVDGKNEKMKKQAIKIEAVSYADY